MLIACGAEEEDAEYVIGATQIVEHPSLDEAYKGFQDAIEEAELNVSYDFQNAQEDINNVTTISQNFVADDVDLIFANSTPSATGALNETNEIPIVFTSVTDPVDAGLVEAMDEPGENITGVIDLHPDSIDKTVEFIDDYFPNSVVGVIYNAGEPNSVVQIETVKEAIEGTSLSIEERTVANSSEVQQAATSLVEDVDVFYIVTDNTVVSVIETVVGIAEDHEVPLFVGEPDSLEAGGFATYGFDYYTIGYRSGEMAVEILTSEKKPSEINVEYPNQLDLMINKEAAEAQGIEWNDEWDDLAEIIE
ncbi:MAG TPA: ABC transporter substrate-binding protein [Bacillota bacterium]|nr:ABC transporter substrate-binding protein [Bacillota bacterium]